MQNVVLIFLDESSEESSAGESSEEEMEEEEEVGLKSLIDDEPDKKDKVNSFYLQNFI